VTGILKHKVETAVLAAAAAVLLLQNQAVQEHQIRDTQAALLEAVALSQLAAAVAVQVLLADYPQPIA